MQIVGLGAEFDRNAGRITHWPKCKLKSSGIPCHENMAYGLVMPTAYHEALLGVRSSAQASGHSWEEMTEDLQNVALQQGLT